MAEAEEDEWDIDDETLKNITDKYRGRQIPLFMDTIPHDTSDNVDLMGLQAVLAESSPDELALNHRLEGNECLKEAATNPRRLVDAVLYYTRGLEAGSKDPALLSPLYANRGHVYLIQKMYVEAIDDCRAAIKHDPSNPKPYFRAAKASFALQLPSQALEFATSGLKVDPGNSALSSLRALAAAEVRRLVAARPPSPADPTAAALLRERGINLVPVDYDIPHSRPPHVEGGEVVWSAVLLMEEEGVCESIVEVRESDTPLQHLKVVFPGDAFAEWDVRRRYAWDRVEVGLEVEGRVLPMGLEETFGDMFAARGIATAMICMHVKVKS